MFFCMVCIILLDRCFFRLILIWLCRWVKLFRFLGRNWMMVEMLVCMCIWLCILLVYLDNLFCILFRLNNIECVWWSRFWLVGVGLVFWVWW